jgi:hypothetical protein
MVERFSAPVGGEPERLTPELCVARPAPRARSKNPPMSSPLRRSHRCKIEAAVTPLPRSCRAVRRCRRGFPFWILVQHCTNTTQSANASSSPNWSANRFPATRTSSVMGLLRAHSRTIFATSRLFMVTRWPICATMPDRKTQA